MLCLVSTLVGSQAFAQSSASDDGGLVAKKGKLRVGVNLSNTATVTKDLASGELRGVAVELGWRFAQTLGVDAEIVTYPSAAQLAEAAAADEWDIGFMAVDGARTSSVSFAAPYMEILNSYLVPPGSPIRRLKDVDQDGVRVAVQAGNAADLFLSRHLSKARLVRIPKPDREVLEVLRRGDADVMATGRGLLLEFSKDWQGSAVLEPHVMLVPHGIGVPSHRIALLPKLNLFLRDARSSGLIAVLIDKYKLVGVRVAEEGAHR